MKIATFNINDVNKRLPNLLQWLAVSRPDVVCLQELKSTDAEFPIDAIRAAGYSAVWRGERSWNGVAILARGAEPVLIRDALPGDTRDKQSRSHDPTRKRSPASVQHWGHEDGGIANSAVANLRTFWAFGW